MRKAWCAVAAVLALSAGAPAAQAGSPLGAVDTREAGPAVRDGKLLPVEVRAQTLAPVVQRAASALAEPGAKPALGTVKIWLSLDNTRSVLYYKPYTLRALGDNIEVWVANDLSFPAGDCRNDSVTVTDAQAQTSCSSSNGHVPARVGRLQRPPARDGASRAEPARVRRLPRRRATRPARAATSSRSSTTSATRTSTTSTQHRPTSPALLVRRSTSWSTATS